MALRRPLVLINGQFQELPVSDGIEASSEYSGVRVVVNEDVTNLVIGQPVYRSAVGKMKRAQANDVAKSRLIGLVVSTTVAINAEAYVQRTGLVVATTDQWDAINEVPSGGLSPHTTYYVSVDNPGKITNIVPSGLGSVLVPVGFAISTTDMELMIDNFRVVMA